MALISFCDTYHMFKILLYLLIYLSTCEIKRDKGREKGRSREKRRVEEKRVEKKKE